MHATSTRYKFSLLLLSPIALAYVVYRSFKDGGWKYFKQRLGFDYQNFPSQPIHVHCASVGELITAKPLILAINVNYPDKPIVITTNTPTAASLARKIKQSTISHHYFPIDLTFSVKRFLKIVQPACSLILETEIWPTYYSQATKQNIPIAIINARLTSKSTKTNTFLKNEISHTLKNVYLLLARSEDDCQRYKNLCPDLRSAHIVGNLKYAASDTNNKQLACTTIKRPFLLAASTHENEEMQLVDHIELLKRKNYLLILAPRYPDRCKQLSQQLNAMGLEVSVRSKHEEITNTTDVYLADTLGELNMFYNECALVFVGGSLISRGGHNILEPASFGKCIIVGPHTDNFALETKELLQANALIQVDNNHDLGLALIKLLKDDTQREQFGKNAEKFMNSRSGILDAYIKHLDPLIKKNN